MAKCPFATWDEISGPVGPFSGGPFKIVHHTTEGGSYAGARAAYKAGKSDPHFTVAGASIYQHVDTDLAARALKNLDGGVQTNRDSAIQIEVVAFAGRPKDAETLKTVARLCRWIEDEHGIDQRWPAGPPRWSTSGGDPGGHNRDAVTWDTEGGHYGHSQVPENTHWDPGYTPAELVIVTPDAVFDAHAALAVAAPARLAEGLQTPVESAEAIAIRVMAALSSGPTLVGNVTRLTARVTVQDVQVEVVVEGLGQRATAGRKRAMHKRSEKKRDLKAAARKRAARIRQR